ncbi:uncharacterized protein [Asterias amurensis]|uniref:uncharacterized protein n=1 Tax=Asterias amurensis TaxID=7602 RepID=UPI003AB409D6
MEHDIMNDREKNKTGKQGMAMQNQPQAWSARSNGSQTNPEDKIALFAVPLPSPKKSDFLCLCKRLFWNVGSSYFTAFCPLSPDETRSLPLSSTVVQMVCASPASQTDSTGNKRVPHDLLAYNASGNIIGVPYLSIHRDPQKPHELQTNGIPYPDISDAAWVPALNVPFVGAPERKNQDIEDVVFIIRNEKQPGDVLHQNGNMPMLFSKPPDISSGSISDKLIRLEESVSPPREPVLGYGLQTKSNDALDLSQNEGLTTLPIDSSLLNPKTIQRPIFPPKITGSLLQVHVPRSTSPVSVKANVKAASTSLYRTYYNSKLKEYQKGPTLTLAEYHDVTTPPAHGSTNEMSDAPNEMVLPQIGSVFSLGECSSPDENLPKRITDALLKATHPDRQRLSGKSQLTTQPVEAAPLSKKTDEPVRQKRRPRPRRRGSPIKPPLEQDTTYHHSATAKGLVRHKPTGSSRETARQNVPIVQTIQKPTSPTSNMQRQQNMAGVQPKGQTNEKNPTGNRTEPDKQSSYRTTCPMQSPQEMGQQAFLHGSRRLFSKEVSSKLPKESFPKPVIKTVLNKTTKDKTSARFLNRKLNNCGLTVREILDHVKVKRENDLQPVESASPIGVPIHVTPHAWYNRPSPTHKESGKSNKIFATSTTETVPMATAENRSVFSTPVTPPGTSIVDSRNDIERVSNQNASDISRVDVVIMEQMPTQTLPSTSVEVTHALRTSQIGMPPTGSIPAGEVTVTNNLGLDNVKFVRRLNSTDVVIDGRIPCLILDKIVNLSSTSKQDSVNAGSMDASHSYTEECMLIDSQLIEPLKEDQSQSSSKYTLENDRASFVYTDKKVKHRGTTLKKPTIAIKQEKNTNRSVSGDSYGFNVDSDVDLTQTDGSQQYLTADCQSSVSKTKKMRFLGKGSKRYDLSVSEHEPSTNHIRTHDGSNFQHMTAQEKVRLLQETKLKQEIALNALKNNVNGV